MNTNKVELSGLIANKQFALIGDTAYTLIDLDMGNTSLPIYFQPSLLEGVSISTPVVVSGSLSMQTVNNGSVPTLVVIGTQISTTQPATLVEPDGLFDAPLDESYFEEEQTSQASNEHEAYTLPLEAFTPSDLEDQYQGVFITSDHQRLDLSSNEVFNNLLTSPNDVHCEVDYDKMWSMTSSELIIETLKRNHTEIEMKAMIWIALSKEIKTKNIMTYEDLKRFFQKFSDIIKIGSRQFSGKHIPYIRVRISHYSGRPYYFRFISPIFNETPTSPLDWNDFKETYNHLNPKHVELQIKDRQMEDLFTRSETPEPPENDKSELEHKNTSLTRSAIIRMNGF